MFSIYSDAASMFSQEAAAGLHGGMLRRAAKCRVTQPKHCIVLQRSAAQHITERVTAQRSAAQHGCVVNMSLRLRYSMQCRDHQLTKGSGSQMQPLWHLASSIM